MSHGQNKTAGYCVVSEKNVKKTSEERSKTEMGKLSAHLRKE